MEKNGLFYAEPVFRPPSEGKRSLLLTVTIGCAYNCTFCYPYRNKKFKIRPFNEILIDIQKAKKLYGNHVTRIFLLDGNAFIAKSKLLIQVAKACFEIHPNLQRISAYTHAKDVLRKSPEELCDIRKAGISMLYLGIETGSDQLLQKINKKVTATEIIESCHKLYEADITLSATFILGLASNKKEASHKHAMATAKLINQINPSRKLDWFISFLTLMVPPTTPIEQAVQSGDFELITPENALIELKTIVENLSPDLHDCIFRSNHASNYLPLKGVLSEDRKQLLTQIEQMIASPQRLRSEGYRRL